MRPATWAMLRGKGLAASPGWPSLPAVESLHDQWLTAPDAAEQLKLVAAIQSQAFTGVPYVQLGQNLP